MESGNSATATSGASGGGPSEQTPFIGSKISLISNSNIRYEGILYTVNTKAATIALTKVQSFGTEDRLADHPVGPHHEIFEYIIFKASDIKDLMVCGPPRSMVQSNNPTLTDPAIVSASTQKRPIPGGSSAARQPAPGAPQFNSGAHEAAAAYHQPEPQPPVKSQANERFNAPHQGPSEGNSQQQRHQGASHTATSGHENEESDDESLVDGGLSQPMSYRNAAVRAMQRMRLDVPVSKSVASEHIARDSHQQPAAGYDDTYYGHRVHHNYQRNRRHQQHPTPYVPDGRFPSPGIIDQRPIDDYDFEEANRKFMQQIEEKGRPNKCTNATAICAAKEGEVQPEEERDYSSDESSEVCHTHTIDTLCFRLVNFDCFFFN